MVPHRSAGQDIQHPSAVAIPVADDNAAPAAGPIGETLHQGRLALTGDPGAPLGAGPAWRGGSNSRASRRRRVTTVSLWRSAASRSMTAYVVSATAMTRRPGSQRLTRSSIWQPQSVSGLWR